MNPDSQQRDHTLPDPLRIFADELEAFALMTLDEQGHIASWNKGAEHIIGFRAEDVLGRHLSCLYPPQLIAAGRPEFDLKQARCKKSVQCDGWRMRQNGSPVRVRGELRRLADQQGQVCGYGLLLRELTGPDEALFDARDSSLLTTDEARAPEETTRETRTSSLVRANLLLKSEVTERRRIEQELLQLQNLLRELAAHQDQIKEDERKRIAREIHDELGQNLLALRIDVSMLLVRAGTRHPLLAMKASAALNQIDAIMSSVRAIINNLRPGVLDFGLHAAIEWQVKEFRRRSNVSCDLMFDHAEFELEDHRATALFRILQESLTNINRHAQASQVRIALKRYGNRLLMSIADNGIGIRPGCRRKVNSFGLVGITERIRHLGGELTIDSVRGRGTTLRITIPIVAEEG
ncbi:PAS domain-containing sensor histidine kinase [Actimicrobium antarcticum]|uniref:PAS domain-containing sensor histidine kinase n=1 Tax=Actimicrobium antarcticum TaxID=1051899 RepID=UPI0031DF9BF6